MEVQTVFVRQTTMKITPRDWLGTPNAHPTVKAAFVGIARAGAWCFMYNGEPWRLIDIAAAIGRNPRALIRFINFGYPWDVVTRPGKPPQVTHYYTLDCHTDEYFTKDEHVRIPGSMTIGGWARCAGVKPSTLRNTFFVSKLPLRSVLAKLMRVDPADLRDAQTVYNIGHTAADPLPPVSGVRSPLYAIPAYSPITLDGVRERTGQPELPDAVCASLAYYMGGDGYPLAETAPDVWEYTSPLHVGTFHLLEAVEHAGERRTRVRYTLTSRETHITIFDREYIA